MTSKYLIKDHIPYSISAARPMTEGDLKAYEKKELMASIDTSLEILMNIIGEDHNRVLQTDLNSDVLDNRLFRLIRMKQALSTVFAMFMRIDLAGKLSDPNIRGLINRIIETIKIDIASSLVDRQTVETMSWDKFDRTIFAIYRYILELDDICTTNYYSYGVKTSTCSNPYQNKILYEYNRAKKRKSYIYKSENIIKLSENIRDMQTVNRIFMYTIFNSILISKNYTSDKQINAYFSNVALHKIVDWMFKKRPTGLYPRIQGLFLTIPDKPLSEGSYGKTYRYCFKGNDDFCIIKKVEKTSDPYNVMLELSAGMRCLNILKVLIPNFCYTYDGIKNNDDTFTYIQNVNGVVLANMKLPESADRESVYAEIILQIICSLYIAQNTCNFIHNDLHTSNILITELPDRVTLTYPIHCSTPYIVNIRTKYIATIIDYGMSSYEMDMKYNGYNGGHIINGIYNRTEYGIYQNLCLLSGDLIHLLFFLIKYEANCPNIIKTIFSTYYKDSDLPYMNQRGYVAWDSPYANIPLNAIIGNAKLWSNFDTIRITGNSGIVHSPSIFIGPSFYFERVQNAQKAQDIVNNPRLMFEYIVSTPNYLKNLLFDMKYYIKTIGKYLTNTNHAIFYYKCLVYKSIIGNIFNTLSMLQALPDDHLSVDFANKIELYKITSETHLDKLNTLLNKEYTIIDLNREFDELKTYSDDPKEFRNIMLDIISKSITLAPADRKFIQTEVNKIIAEISGFSCESISIPKRLYSYNSIVDNADDSRTVDSTIIIPATEHPVLKWPSPIAPKPQKKSVTDSERIRNFPPPPLPQEVAVIEPPTRKGIPFSVAIDRATKQIKAENRKFSNTQLKEAAIAELANDIYHESRLPPPPAPPVYKTPPTPKTIKSSIKVAVNGLLKSSGSSKANKLIPKGLLDFEDSEDSEDSSNSANATKADSSTSANSSNTTANTSLPPYSSSHNKSHKQVSEPLLKSLGTPTPNNEFQPFPDNRISPIAAAQ